MTNKLLKAYYIRFQNLLHNYCALSNLINVLEDLFGMYIIDVDQERFSEYNKDSKFESWRRFIGAETKEELESIAKGDKILETALKESLRFMNEDYVQDFSREELLYESRLDTAKEEGKLEGKKSKAFEIAKNLIINTTMSLEDISKITGLTIKELENIKS